MAGSKKSARVSLLAQHDEQWVAFNRLAPAWVDSPSGTPYRPRLIVVIETVSGQVLHFKYVDRRVISAPDLLKALQQAMLADALPGAVPWQPHRPSAIVVEGEEVARAITPDLAKLGIDCLGMPHIDGADEFMHQMAAHMSPERATGLARLPGMSAFAMEEFYSAAADYYRAAPWNWLANRHLIEFHYSADDKPRYVCVMGNAREEFGLSLYDTLEEFERMSRAESPGETDRLMSVQPMSSLTFGAPWDGTPFEDLDDIERYHYPIAGRKAYPILLKVMPPATRVDPAYDDVSRYAAVMRALPEFVARHMDASGRLPHPAQATLSLPDMHHGHTISLRFPVIDDAVIRTPDMEARGLVNEASLAHWLAGELQARVPFQAQLSAESIADLRGSPLNLRPGQRLTCLGVYEPDALVEILHRHQLPGDVTNVILDEETGEFGGVMCRLKAGQASLLAPLTQINADDPDLPCRHEVDAYQFIHYCARMSKQDQAAARR